MNYAGQRLGDHDHWLVEGLTGWHVQLGIVSTEGCFEWLASTTRMQHLLLWWCTQCSTWKICIFNLLWTWNTLESLGVSDFFLAWKTLSGAIELAESTFREISVSLPVSSMWNLKVWVEVGMNLSFWWPPFQRNKKKDIFQMETQCFLPRLGRQWLPPASCGWIRWDEGSCCHMVWQGWLGGSSTFAFGAILASKGESGKCTHVRILIEI